MASLPTAECCEHNVAAVLDVTSTPEIVESAVIDGSGMRRTEGAQESLNEAIVAPSQSLRRFIELVPCSDGRHVANEVAILPATKDWVFFKSYGDEAASWRRYVCHSHRRFTTWLCRADKELLPEQLWVCRDG